jgi:hypothetical protein
MHVKEVREPNERRIEVLLEQYKLLEERRKTFGQEFMQTFGFFIAAVVVVVGLLGEDNPRLLAVVLRVAGSIFIVIALLAQRLRKRQDDCQGSLAEIEDLLQEEVGDSIGRLPGGAKLGARMMIVAMLIVIGLALLLLPWSLLLS